MGAGDARGVGAGRRAGRVVGSRAISDDDRFFEDLPAFDAFHGVVDAANYRPLPDDWARAVADVVGSTAAIAAGRYKAVNMAGAAVISAIQNTVGRHEIRSCSGVTARSWRLRPLITWRRGQRSPRSRRG